MIENSDIVYSCYHQVSRKGENFVAQHTISYQLSGSFMLSDNRDQHTAHPGDFHLIRKNQLVKFAKIPPPNGACESLNIYLSDETLKNFANEYELKAEHSTTTEALVKIDVNAVLENFIVSLKALLQSNLNNKSLTDLKIKELLLILLQTKPALKNILFDFSEPHKIDLEAFMNQNYRYNVNLERFARLTGRSLATFKRDFEKVFQTSPHQWILKKRLDEAHYLLKEEKRAASDIFVDLGFEDLSHFSHAFKKQFGYSPKSLPNTEKPT